MPLIGNRCMSCGTVDGLWIEAYEEYAKKHPHEEAAEFLAGLGITRGCCITNMITRRDFYREKSSE